MSNLTISVFQNQILLEIIKEVKLFSKFKVKFYDNFDQCTKNAILNRELVIVFMSDLNKADYEKIKNKNIPTIVITKPTNNKNVIKGEFVEQLNLPFYLLDFEKKVISSLSRYQFRKSSLIDLRGYAIDKNERKIKKNNSELQLTEREIDLLILFSKNDKPLSRNYVLEQVWHYSSESDTHTVETHIHRLRKKIAEKFNDNNFIKNNDEGYFI